MHHRPAQNDLVDDLKDFGYFSDETGEAMLKADDPGNSIVCDYFNGTHTQADLTNSIKETTTLTANENGPGLLENCGESIDIRKSHCYGLWRLNSETNKFDILKKGCWLNDANCGQEPKCYPIVASPRRQKLKSDTPIPHHVFCCCLGDRCNADDQKLLGHYDNQMLEQELSSTSPSTHSKGNPTPTRKHATSVSNKNNPFTRENLNSSDKSSFYAPTPDNTKQPLLAVKSPDHYLTDILDSAMNTPSSKTLLIAAFSIGTLCLVAILAFCVCLTFYYRCNFLSRRRRSKNYNNDARYYKGESMRKSAAAGDDRAFKCCNIQCNGEDQRWYEGGDYDAKTYDLKNALETYLFPSLLNGEYCNSINSFRPYSPESLNTSIKNHENPGIYYVHHNSHGSKIAPSGNKVREFLSKFYKLSSGKSSNTFTSHDQPYNYDKNFGRELTPPPFNERDMAKPIPPIFPQCRHHHWDFQKQINGLLNHNNPRSVSLINSQGLILPELSFCLFINSLQLFAPSSRNLIKSKTKEAQDDGNRIIRPYLKSNGKMVKAKTKSFKINFYERLLLPSQGSAKYLSITKGCSSPSHNPTLNQKLVQNTGGAEPLLSGPAIKPYHNAGEIKNYVDNQCINIIQKYLSPNMNPIQQKSRDFYDEFTLLSNSSISTVFKCNLIDILPLRLSSSDTNNCEGGDIIQNALVLENDNNNNFNNNNYNNSYTNKNARENMVALKIYTKEHADCWEREMKIYASLMYGLPYSDALNGSNNGGLCQCQFFKDNNYYYGYTNQHPNLLPLIYGTNLANTNASNEDVSNNATNSSTSNVSRETHDHSTTYHGKTDRQECNNTLFRRTTLQNNDGLGSKHGDMILITPYQSQGSLYDYLRCHVISWNTLIAIALDIARGLAYLHNTDNLFDYVELTEPADNLEMDQNLNVSSEEPIINDNDTNVDRCSVLSPLSREDWSPDRTISPLNHSFKSYLPATNTSCAHTPADLFNESVLVNNDVGGLAKCMNANPDATNNTCSTYLGEDSGTFSKKHDTISHNMDSPLTASPTPLHQLPSSPNIKRKTKLSSKKPSIVHKDLKSKNILLEQFTDSGCPSYQQTNEKIPNHEDVNIQKNDDNEKNAHNVSLRARIGDFGSSLIMVSATPSEYRITDIHRAGFGFRMEQQNMQQKGTLRYMAPEILEGAISYTIESFLKIDVYSFALILWELMTRCTDISNIFLLLVELRKNDPTLLSEPFQLPYERELGVNPSMEELQTAVCNKGVRPRIIESWNKHPLACHLTATLRDCWEKDPEARISSITLYERIRELSITTTVDTTS